MKLLNRKILSSLLLSWLFGFAALGTRPLLAAPTENLIRVRMMTAQKNLEVEGWALSIQSAQKFIPVAIPRDSRKKIWISGQSFVVDDGIQIKYYFEPFLRIRGEGLRVNGKPQPRDLFLTRDLKKSEMDVVGVLPLEQYLVGVLAGEMPLGWPRETLKAQAVVARSYALSLMKERARFPFQVESSILDQVFLVGDLRLPKYSQALRAVEETEGLVLKNQKGQLVKTFFHAHCGGHTENAKNVWGGRSTESVADSFCEIPSASPQKLAKPLAFKASEKSFWRAYFSKSEFEKRLGARVNETISQISFRSAPRRFEKSDSLAQAERVQEVFLEFEMISANRIKAHRSLVLTGNQFREKLGYQVLKSTWLHMIRTENGYSFEGRGFGHGVGMCQAGAKFLGDRGQSFQEILGHYFPGTKTAIADGPQQTALEQRSSL